VTILFFVELSNIPALVKLANKLVPVIAVRGVVVGVNSALYTTLDVTLKLLIYPKGEYVASPIVKSVVPD
jgi:hypothetical protein